MNIIKTILRLIIYIITFPATIVMTFLCWIFIPIVLLTELVNWLCNEECYYIDLSWGLLLAPFVGSYEFVFKDKLPW